jgi:hypothetical protein
MPSVQVGAVLLASDGEGSPVVMRHGVGVTWNSGHSCFRPRRSRRASRRQNGNSALLRHWTPIEKVKECGKLLSECLKAIPI